MKPTPEQEARAAATIEARQMTIEDYLASIPQQARGQTCEAEDIPRLNEQGRRVYGVMRDLGPWTLKQISARTGDPEASVSARIREIRRYIEKDGKGTVKREPVKGHRGLFTYTMRLNRYHGAA
jgi:hypothetical protein